MNKITVVIPAYNAGKYSKQGGGSLLKECLDSYFRMTTPTLDIIVIDDGSIDDTASIAGEYPVKLIRNSVNMGVRDSVNKVLPLVTTPYMLRMDSDVVFTDPKWHVYMTEHMDAYPECGMCSANQYLHDGRLWAAGDTFEPNYQHLKDPALWGSFKKVISSMACFAMYRMTAWEAAGGLNGPKWLRAEAEDLHMRMRKLGYEVHILPFGFRHHHQVAMLKRGTYNDIPRAEAEIREFMWENHGVDFYGDKGGTKLK